ncbi:RMD1 family protein [Paraflavitalea sp. CAU 1676]|uniref:RMD1 family protein n=1 Tax=Paraflavitalea sp. CAU 1676 TaxID=3032598 RepID=UPI0023DCC519|nr:RMD1 family protein [Paraflavitalea sp. CAU 1676]MDF2193273.1 RMD1 family protein [Paraflavitalea sp. CAU 1676]
MRVTTIGYHLGGRLDLKLIKNSLTFRCVYADPTELIYETGEYSWFQVFDYGSVVFFGIEKTLQTDIITSIRRILNLEVNELESEETDIEMIADAPTKVLFDKIIVNHINVDVAKIVMLNIAQSVALDYYIDQTNILLEQTAFFGVELEEKGKFSIKGKALLKYIGKALNLKNRIARNLYIFDSPDITWNDQYLNDLHTQLNHELDIRIRYRSLQESLDIIQENLEIFKDINQHSHSSTLEWIIIILIAVEILNIFFGKLF